MAHEHIFPRMVHDDLLRRVDIQLRARIERLAAVKTSSDARRYRDRVRGQFSRSFTPFPARTDIKPRITGTQQGNGFNIEMVR